MDIYLYDGSLQGFYTAVFDAYKNNNQNVNISWQSVQYTLDCNVYVIATDPEKAERISRFIRQKTQGEVRRHIAVSFKSGAPDKENIIYAFLCKLFKHGEKATEMHNDSAVSAFFTLSRAVLHECHLMQGFIRFKQCENQLYYASFAPDHDVTELIMPHFTQRFPRQQLIIHDTTRNIAGLYNGSRSLIINCPENFSAPNFSHDEELFSNMWKMYFNTITVSGRENKKLQDRCMPRRYRKFMNETH